MSDSQHRFSFSLAKDAVYKSGLRSFMEYRDLGIGRRARPLLNRSAPGSQTA